MEGLKLTELGLNEAETQVLARRMIEMGQAVFDRIFVATEEEGATEKALFEGGPKVREMVWALRFGEFLRIYAIITDSGETTLGAVYYPREMFFFQYGNVDLGSVKVEQLDQEPGEAARELVYCSDHIESGDRWAILLWVIKNAKVSSDKYPHAPWGVPQQAPSL